MIYYKLGYFRLNISPRGCLITEIERQMHGILFIQFICKRKIVKDNLDFVGIMTFSLIKYSSVLIETSKSSLLGIVIGFTLFRQISEKTIK
jgi:hypothetical protein